jgi:hypothetical protein
MLRQGEKVDSQPWFEVNLSGTTIRQLQNGNASQCSHCGALLVPETRKQHSNFHATFTNARHNRYAPRNIREEAERKALTAHAEAELSD